MFTAITWIIPALLVAGILAVIFGRPALSLRKQVQLATYHPIGQVIEYTYTRHYHDLA